MHSPGVHQGAAPDTDRVRMRPALACTACAGRMGLAWHFFRLYFPDGEED